MAILKPEIQEALRAAGIAKESKGTLSENLDSAGLSLESTLEEIAQLMNNSSSEHLRLRAAELSAKLHGLLKDSQQPLPSITIVISDPSAPVGINPILLPRELPA